MDIIFDLIHATDSQERARGRAKVNARLRIFLEKIVVLEDTKLQIHFKPEYKDIDAHMCAEYYGSRDMSDAAE